MDLRLLRYFVAVAEERHFGRAAARLHMSQPPLSRAVRALEADLGATLLDRSPAGVRLTEAGAVLLDEARALLERSERARTRVAAVGGSRVLTVGVLADSADHLGASLAASFRRDQPDVQVRVREFDLCEPSAGLRSGLVDVAITRGPFDETGIATCVLGEDPIGVVLVRDDPLAGRAAVRLEDLADRSWFRFPEGTDEVWCAYWVGSHPRRRRGPVVRTVAECLHAVCWNGAVGLGPVTHDLPEGLVSVPVLDMAPSRVLLAWPRRGCTPLATSFVTLAAAVHRHEAHRPG